MGPSRSCWNGTANHCSRRRLLGRGLEFHMCTINKSAHTKKIWKLIVCTSYMSSSEEITDDSFEQGRQYKGAYCLL